MTAGSGLTVEVRLVKQGGLPVTYTNDPDVDASAIRTVDLEKKFHLSPYELAAKCGVSRNGSIALRRHLGLDANDDHFSHRFQFGKSTHLRFSDNALRAMKESLAAVNLDRVWASHRTLAYNKKEDTLPPCDQPGCVG